MEWLGRAVVIRPEGHGLGVHLWFEKDRPDFDEQLARLAEITGYPVTDEHL